MRKETGTDSIILQVEGDALSTSRRIAEAMDGKLQVMKNIPIRPTKEDKRLWYQIYRRPIPMRASFIALLHTHRGQSIPIVRNGNAKGIQLEFHGLQALEKDSYSQSDNAQQLEATLQEFIDSWNEPVRMMRLDRSIDLIGQQWSSYTNSRTHRNLCKKHGASTFEDTTLYYQPKKPTYTKVLAYDKREKNNLMYDSTRIEFRFLPQYWRGLGAANAQEIIETATARADMFINKRLSVKW